MVELLTQQHITGHTALASDTTAQVYYSLVSSYYTVSNSEDADSSLAGFDDTKTGHSTGDAGNVRR